METPFLVLSESSKVMLIKEGTFLNLNPFMHNVVKW